MAAGRQALVVGIEGYQHEPSLTAAAGDARRIAELLRRDALGGLKNWSVTELTDYDDTKQVTTARLKAELVTLFLHSALGVDLLFYFAGHAVQRAWGAELVAYDGAAISFNDLMSLVRQAKAKSITIILDCCLAGELANEVGMPAAGNDYDDDPFRPDRAVIRENLTILSATQSRQQAAERRDHGGLFTDLLCGGLAGAAADLTGAVTALNLYTHASQAFDTNAQRPILKSHVVHPVVLRQVEPLVDIGRLAALTSYFPTHDAQLRLSVAHDYDAADPASLPRTLDEAAKRPGARPKQPFEGTAAQIQLDHLKQWRDVRLVRNDQGIDFWDVCKYGLTVGLTPLGQYYWHLARRGAL